jgi:hypothetical protein
VKKLIVLATTAFFLLASVAFANSFSDPDDMTSPVDIRQLVHRDKGGDVHAFKVTTDDNWTCSYLEPKLTKVHFLFDGGSKPDADLVGKLRCLKFEGGRDLVLFLSGRDTNNSYEPISVIKPDRHTMRFKFSFDLVELTGKHVDMYIKVTDGQAEGCTSAFPCTERAPDTGRWRLY